MRVEVDDGGGDSDSDGDYSGCCYDDNDDYSGAVITKMSVGLGIDIVHPLTIDGCGGGPQLLG